LVDGLGRSEKLPESPFWAISGAVFIEPFVGVCKKSSGWLVGWKKHHSSEVHQGWVHRYLDRSLVLFHRPERWVSHPEGPLFEPLDISRSGIGQCPLSCRIDTEINAGTLHMPQNRTVLSVVNTYNGGMIPDQGND